MTDDTRPPGPCKHCGCPGPGPSPTAKADPLVTKPGIVVARRLAPREQRVLQLVSDECAVSVTSILSKDRFPRTIRARYISMWVLRHAFGYSLPDLGRAFGQADHSSAMNAMKKIGGLLSSPKPEAGALREFLARLVSVAQEWATDGETIASKLATANGGRRHG